jgi:signal transduction histidine kinase
MNEKNKFFKDLKALVLEDSPTQAIILKESLEAQGLLIRVAKDGVEGLALLNEDIPDVVISDIVMPKMDGFEFCKHAKTDSKFKNIPIILLTNLSDSMDVIRGIECGADSFLTKPCPMTLLLSNISDVLANKKIRQESTETQVLELTFQGKKHQLEVDQAQLTDLLLSTYSNAVQKNQELGEAYRKLNLMHQELEKKNVELEKLNEIKNQFLGMAAHDLRNPLSVIQGYSSLLLDKFDQSHDTTSVKMIERIQQSSSFMLGLINDLLNISIIESGKVHLEFEELDIFTIVKENIDLEVSLAEKKGIQIKVKADENIPKVMCDPNKIKQILNNLLTNAIKYSNENTQIEITLQALPEEVIIAVKDQGVGIPQQELDRIFQAFVTGTQKPPRGDMSTGLGLAIVKKLVSAHKGRIWVNSEVDKGSTFFVSLPYKQDQRNISV